MQSVYAQIKAVNPAFVLPVHGAVAVPDAETTKLEKRTGKVGGGGFLISVAYKF